MGPTERLDALLRPRFLLVFSRTLSTLDAGTLSTLGVPPNAGAQIE